jgi:tRNA threonylcarbamoyladenosine biosynthesis protein TsaB
MILALMTDGPTSRIWLIKDNQAPAEPTLEWDSGRELADQLLGRIKVLLEKHQFKIADVSGIIIFSGPGSFTSLRIGHTVANALADSLGVAVVGAMDDNWITAGLKLLPDTPLGRPALPHYGAEANITRPKP